MVSVLLVFLLFAVLQVALYCYARNVVAAAVGDAARYAATSGTNPAAGRTRAVELIEEALGQRLASDIVCDGTSWFDAGLAVTTVRCRGHVRALFAPLVIPITIDMRSSSISEPDS